MSLTKKNNCKESIFDLMEPLTWSLLEKRIGDDLNTLESTLSSGLSSTDTPELKDIFQTFTIKSSNSGHLTTPNIFHLN
jgi:hypothetical protein